MVDILSICRHCSCLSAEGYSLLVCLLKLFLSIKYNFDYYIRKYSESWTLWQGICGKAAWAVPAEQLHTNFEYKIIGFFYSLFVVNYWSYVRQRCCESWTLWQGICGKATRSCTCRTASYKFEYIMCVFCYFFLNWFTFCYELLVLCQAYMLLMCTAVQQHLQKDLIPSLSTTLCCFFLYVYIL